LQHEADGLHGHQQQGEGEIEHEPPQPQRRRADALYAAHVLSIAARNGANIFRHEIGLDHDANIGRVECSSMTAPSPTNPPSRKYPLISGGSGAKLCASGRSPRVEPAHLDKAFGQGAGPQSRWRQMMVIEVGQGTASAAGSVPGRLAQPNISAMS